MTTTQQKAGDLVKLGLRIPTDLRRDLKVAAAMRGQTMEQVIIEALEQALLSREPEPVNA